MDTKEIKINCPEGYEIDKENSTFECIKFKPTKKGLPRTWEEFVENYPIKEGECFIGTSSTIVKYTDGTGMKRGLVDKNALPSKKLAEAMLALCQLIQLRDCYNDGWKPDYQTNCDTKYSIEIINGDVSTACFGVTQRVLTFGTKELRDQFLENFRDLIEIAKPLL